MQQDILVNWIRGSTQLNAKPIPLRKDQMKWQTAAEMGGESPYDSFWLRTVQGVGTFDPQRQDLLQDIKTAEKFRIFGRPMTYDQSYIRIPVEQIIGTRHASNSTKYLWSSTSDTDASPTSLLPAYPTYHRL